VQTTVSAAAASLPTDTYGSSARSVKMVAYDYCRDGRNWGMEMPFPPPTVRLGSVDTQYPSAVLLAQCYLNMALNPNNHRRLYEDGEFGSLTRQAVLTFQADWCGDVPPVDGIVGPRTWAGLRSWATSGVYAC
jgi:peptidoglycan hydrolase-like protein with peptidoglycan-binding domain